MKEIIPVDISMPTLYVEGGLIETKMMHSFT